MQNSRIFFVTMLGGLAVAMGCSSSSSSSTPPAEGGTGDDSATSSGGSSSGASSSSGGADAGGGGFACANAAGCMGGQVCCLALMGTSPGTSCAAAPCPAIGLLGGPVQICSMDSECKNGEVCGTPTNMLLAMGLAAMMGHACVPPSEGGTSEGGSSSGGGDGGDASSSSGGEGGSSDAGGQ